MDQKKIKKSIKEILWQARKLKSGTRITIHEIVAIDTIQDHANHIMNILNGEVEDDVEKSADDYEPEV